MLEMFCLAGNSKKNFFILIFYLEGCRLAEQNFLAVGVEMDVIYLFDIIGTFTFAVSGTLAASEKRFDLLGAFLAALLTAVGGGTTRDVLLGSTPVFWMHDINYLVTIVCAMMFCFVFPKYLLKLKETLFFFDTVGIAVFTVIGINKAMMFNVHPVFAIIMGAVTAVMGGVFRDIFCNEVPLIMRKEIYGIACLAGGAIFFFLKILYEETALIYTITILVIALIRFVSVRYKLSLPIVHDLIDLRSK